MGSEKEFLENYSIEAYERPSITTDIAAFTLLSKDEESYRHDPESSLSLLLVKRGGHPFKGCWALPGGFLQSGETVEECALREITEETGVTPRAIMPAGVFSKPNRDPRGWIISNAFVSVIAEPVVVKGGDDAAEAAWFTVKYNENENGSCTLTLRHGDTEIITELTKTQSKYESERFEIKDSGGTAFDHAKIIACALTKLRKEAQNVETLFDFLPERFTLAELQRVQETITDVPLLTANFRRKIADFVEETDTSTVGAGHRPAKLYTKK